MAVFRCEPISWHDMLALATEKKQHVSNKPQALVCDIDCISEARSRSDSHAHPETANPSTTKILFPVYPASLSNSPRNLSFCLLRDSVTSNVATTSLSSDSGEATEYARLTWSGGRSSL